MSPHPFFNNFEIQKHYQNKLTFIVVYSKNSLSKIKDGPYVIYLEVYKSIETYWIALQKNSDSVTYSDSFGVKHIEKKKKFISNKNVKLNIYIIHVNYSIICTYFCVGFIDFMLIGKSLLDYTNLFSPNEYEKNNKIIPKMFSVTQN